MTEHTIDSETNSKAGETAPQRARKAAKKPKAAKKKEVGGKKAARTKKAGEPKADRVNKKAEVIALLKRTKGATLAEIMAATSWQAHTVRGFVSILGGKGGQSIESTKNAAGERSYKIIK